MSGSSRFVPTTAGGGDLGRSDLDGLARAMRDERFHCLDEVLTQGQAMTLAVLNQGVGHAGQFPSPAGAKEQIVLRAELQGSDRVLDEVVADFDTSIAEVVFKAAPLTKGVGDGLAHEAFGEVTCLNLLKVAANKSKRPKIGHAVCA